MFCPKAIAAIRGLPDTVLDRSIRILAISGGSRAIFSNILGAAITYGAHDSLKKPFTAQQLRDKVGRLLQS